MKKLISELIALAKIIGIILLVLVFIGAVFFLDKVRFNISL